MISSSSFIMFLLQDRQLKPNSFTVICASKYHSFGFKGSAINTLKVPSLHTIAKHNPWALFGMNFISSIALCSDLLLISDHSYFYPSPLSVLLHSYILIWVSREHVAIMVPNYGLAHLTFQAEAPCILMDLSSIHLSFFLVYIRMILSLQAAASLLPVQSKLISWTIALGGNSPIQSILASYFII